MGVLTTEDVVRSGGRLSPLMATIRSRKAEKLLQGVKRGRLLDIGCGHYPLFLTRSPFRGRFGIDREQGPSWRSDSAGRLQLSVVDIESSSHLPFRDSTFDAVTMLAVVEHLDPETLPHLLIEVKRLLADGGRLVVTTPPPWSDPVLRILSRLGLSSRIELEEHQTAYTPSDLCDLVEHAGFGQPDSGLFGLGLNAWASGDNAPASGRPRRRMRWLVRWLPAALLVAGAAMLVARERVAFADAIDLITASSWINWLGAMVLVVAGRGVLAGISIVLVSRQLTGTGALTTGLAWMRSATAKYVPGVVWHALALVERLRRAGVPAASGAAVYYVDTMGTIVAAVLIGAIAVPALVSAEAGTALWLILAVPAALSLHPRVFALGLRMLGTLTGRRFDNVQLSWRTVISVICLHGSGWLLVGCAIRLILVALDASASWPLVFAATSLSWAAGLLAVPVPAGLGVREAALVALLASQVPVEVAVATALVSRALFVALDVLSFTGSFAVEGYLKMFGRTSKARR